MLYASLRGVFLDIKRLPEQTDDSEEQGQHVEYVVALVALAESVGQQALIAETGIVYYGNAADPVAEMRLAVAGFVVLATAKFHMK